MPGQIKNAERVRSYLDKILQNYKPGTIFYSSNITTSLSKKCRTITALGVGMALRERSDVELVSTGVWRKV